MDLRIQKTYRALIEGFEQLLSRNPYETITVAAICDAANIRRTTFYKHFKDKDEFLLFFVSRLSERYLPPAAPKEGKADVLGECEEVVDSFAGFLLEHESYVDNLSGASTNEAMSTMLCDLLAKTLRVRHDGWFGEFKGTDGATLADAAEFAAGGFMQLLWRWWSQGHHPEERRRVVRSASALVCRVLAG